MSQLTLRRLPRRYHSAVLGTLLTTSLTAIVSLVLTMKNVGVTLDAAPIWLTAWVLATLIAVPARFILAPLVGKVVSMLVEPPIAS